ncbi:hypothetical protein HYALB_00000638 [Hymenoscyphus albidus]|uniref:Uncharacterized protein n=1 Tax=Hymenoscyphus albidus TaxID=595503 RepID=A0A9N9M3J1_9HELO|nr:hypothetical protein HYALB_00000638 [Hymenoscyphus albidus]
MLPIFCCSNAVPSHTSQNNKPYNDENRSVHDDHFRSFLEFAVRRQRQLDFIGIDNETRLAMLPDTTPSNEEWVPQPVLTPEALANNPIQDTTQYVIHLTSRQDFGRVYSHRYFACPYVCLDGTSAEQREQLKKLNWDETTLVHWFAKGYPFRLPAEKWDVKCAVHGKFFRMSLRPNLNLRRMHEIEVKKPEPMEMKDDEGEEHGKFAQTSSRPNLNWRQKREVEVNAAESMKREGGEIGEHREFLPMGLRSGLEWRQMHEVEVNKPDPIEMEVDEAVSMEVLDDMDGDTEYISNTDGETEAESLDL